MYHGSARAPEGDDRISGALSYQWIHPSSDVWPGDGPYLPWMQSVHWLLLARPTVLVNLPAKHSLQLFAALSGPNRPAGHCTQTSSAVAPVSLLYLPTPQFLQLVEPDTGT